MNERLNELRLDAGIAQLKDDPRLVVIDREGNVIDPLIGLEKFAALIVLECANTASNFVRGPGGDHGVKRVIQQHFGVE